MKSDYEKLKEKYKKVKRQKENLEIENDYKDSIIKKQEKKNQKLEKENYEYKLLLIEKIKEEIW